MIHVNIYSAFGTDHIFYMHNHISSLVLMTALWVANTITPDKTEKKIKQLSWDWKPNFLKKSRTLRIESKYKESVNRRVTDEQITIYSLMGPESHSC